MIADIKKWAKVTTLDIEAKFMLCSKWVIDSIVRNCDSLLLCTCFSSLFSCCPLLL